MWLWFRQCIVVIDTLPTQIFTPTTTTCGGVRHRDTITWTIPALDRYESRYITCALSLPSDLAGVHSLINQASVSAWPGVQAHASASTIITDVLGGREVSEGQFKA